MKTYYLTFQVLPAIYNQQHDLLQGALASCWIVAEDSQSAYAKAKFFVSKDDWEINQLKSSPVEVTKENFLEKEIGLEQYIKAQEDGIAIFYTAWARDASTITEPTTLPVLPSFRINLHEYIRKQKKLSQNGRCLHYDNGVGCNKIINAHSIQKNRSLSAIAVDGKVYEISKNIGDLKNNKGKFIYKKNGINKVSTFLGFCKKHDNELFEAIDNWPLLPTNQQVFLYAYRSLCREFFVKENAYDLFDSQLSGTPDKHAVRDLLETTKLGTTFALENLKAQKFEYDSSLCKKFYTDIKYVLFISKQKPFLAFSGLFYPDFDFMGNQLQDLGDFKKSLALITICSAPMANNEWGFLFAWHKSSSNVCVAFMRSLATIIHDKKNLGDFLFRLAVSNCENIAISPEWWEKLPAEHKEQISTKVTSMIDLFEPIKPTYLMNGLEGIVQWSFEEVICNME